MKKYQNVKEPTKPFQNIWSGHPILKRLVTLTSKYSYEYNVFYQDNKQIILYSIWNIIPTFEIFKSDLKQKEYVI